VKIHLLYKLISHPHLLAENKLFVIIQFELFLICFSSLTCTSVSKLFTWLFLQFDMHECF